MFISKISAISPLPIGSERGTTQLLALRDLAEKVRQYQCIADMVSGDLDGPDLQRLLVNAELDIAPDQLLAATILARMPFDSILDLDACAVDQQV